MPIEEEQQQIQKPKQKEAINAEPLQQQQASYQAAPVEIGKVKDKYGLVEKPGGELEDLEEDKEKALIREKLKMHMARVRKEQIESEVFSILHDTKYHSEDFARRINEAREHLSKDTDIYTLRHVPDRITMGSEYNSYFNNRLSDKERASKKKNKRSRLWQKEENAKLLETSVEDYKTASFDALNRAMTKQALRADAKEYNDLAAFMDHKDDVKNIELVNLYYGKSIKKGPGGYEGQDVQKALDYMAGQLFAIDIRTLHFENDTELVKNAPTLEKIADQVAAFERLSAKHQDIFWDKLDEYNQMRMRDKLDSLRAISAYYLNRKEIITNKYYKDHYNDELCADVRQTADKDQSKIARLLEESDVLAKSMLMLNTDGKAKYFDERTLDRYKRNDHKELTSKAHKLADERANKELMRLQERIASLNKTDPVLEKKEIHKDMVKVMDRAFVPVQKPSNRTGFWSKVKNRLMLGYRYVFAASIGLVTNIGLNAVMGTEKLLMEGKRLKNAQEKRIHDQVPGRKGETFREEVVHKDDKGEDMEIYSDVRRGPLIWEKISAGDPEEPPEVTFMAAQPIRGSKVAFGGGIDSGHAFIGLSYSRYNKATKKKERYRLTMGFYPGDGLLMKTGMAMTGGATIAGVLKDDAGHDYDVARRYKVKPGDINKILRASETYADKGYNAFKRNCTNFVVDMAKTVNLPVSKEFFEDEMIYTGAVGFVAQTALATGKAGYYLGANAITSRMNKKSLSYQNFGQKLFTKEDVKRYYKTAGKGEAIKKGYSPGAVGETLRSAHSGELVAGYQSHLKLSNDQIQGACNRAGTKAWAKISTLLPFGELSDIDIEYRNYFTKVSDGGLTALAERPEEITTEAVKQVHKTVRTAMQKVNEYYSQRLGNDKRCNQEIMALLSLYELVLTKADDIYDKIWRKDAKGDVGRLRYDFVNTEQSLQLRNGYSKDSKCFYINMEPGTYEGYLMMDKTPEQAVREFIRLEELTEKKQSGEELSNSEKEEQARLKDEYDLACQFASANRYLLDKDSFDEKDIQYAFVTLPKQEKAVSGSGFFVAGDLVRDHSASSIYRCAILEHVIGGIKELKLEQATDSKQFFNMLDDHLAESFTANEELAEKILRCFAKENDMPVHKLVSEFLMMLDDTYFQSVYTKEDKMDPGAFTNAIYQLVDSSKTGRWLTMKFDKIVNGGGVM